MERKFTSEVDLSEPATFYNMKTFDYWNLVEDSAGNKMTKAKVTAFLKTLP